LNDISEQHAWYAVYTMPQAEKKIALYLSRVGIDHYLPLVPKQRRWSDRVKIIEFPLFPGYVFVNINYWKQRLGVLQNHNALKFVQVEGRPAELRTEEIESLKILAAAQRDLQSHPEENFPPGQPVLIRSGVFKGARGVVAKVKNQMRLFVKIEGCHLCASAEIDAMDLERVPVEHL